MTLLSPPVQAVLELFQGPLADVRFADVDAAGLAQLATEVEAAAASVAHQEALLGELRQSLTERQDALLLLAQRAVAYARVYAEHDEVLTEQLSRIALPRAGKARKLSATKSEGVEAPSSEAASLNDPAAAASTAPGSAAAEPDTQTEERLEAAAPAKGKRRIGRSLARHAP